MTNFHQYNTVHARRYGMAAAAVLSYIRYWIGFNKDNGINLHEGRTWIFHTIEDFRETFDYLSTKQLRLAINKLISSGVLMTGHFGNCFERKLWYAFKDEGAFLYEAAGNVPRQPEDRSDPPEVLTPTPICPKGQMDLPDSEGVPESANPSDPKGQMTFVQKGKSAKIIISKYSNRNLTVKGGKGGEAAPSREEKRKEENAGASAAPAICCAAAGGDEPPLRERKKMFHGWVRGYAETHPKQYPAPFLNHFCRHWTEADPETGRMRFQDQKYFTVSYRLERFWKQASPDEKRGYWEEHHLRYGQQ